MASFDFRIPVAPTERSFAHALLAYLQRLALLRQYSRPTVVRFRWSKPTSNAEYHHYHVYVDGDFAELQAFCFDSSGALFHYGEGLLSAKRHKIRESLVHQVVCLAFAKAMFEFNEDIVDLTTQMHAAGIPIVPNTYIFGRAGDGNVNWLLGTLTVALTNWRNGKINPEAVAEQLHTTLEGLMRKALAQPSKGQTFKQLVAQATSEVIISSEEAASILRLNELRRNAKHRRQRVPAKKLEAELPEGVSACHKLVSKLCFLSKRDNKALQPNATGGVG